MLSAGKYIRMGLPLHHAIFDLDDTLYAPDCGLWDELARRIDCYMIERAGIPAAEVAARRLRYYSTFGTTLAGLTHDFPDIDPYEYLRYVHDLPYARFLRPEPALDEMLASLPLKLAIFTNADRRHAEQVLAHLGVAHHFDAIVDIHALGFVNKPQLRAYHILLDQLGARAEACVLIEDSPRNLQTARALGMTTILVRPDAGSHDVAHFHVAHILEVGPLIRGLLG